MKDRNRIYLLFICLLFTIWSMEAQQRNTPDGIRFQVDTVDIAQDTLKEIGLQRAFTLKTEKELLCVAPQQGEMQIVPINGNAFLRTIHLCYKSHRPLVLTPDVVWLVICQGVSQHVRLNIDSLKPIIFKDVIPNIITVRNDNLTDTATHEWQNVINALAIQTQQHTRSDAYSFFVPQFSTTTSVETTAYQVTLLETYEDVFGYIITTGCGIPYITLSGQKSDWEKIYSQLDYLETLGLADWASELKPVIQQFINVYDNKVDEVFWQDIYKNREIYLREYVSGWILKFFPYIEKLKLREMDTETGEWDDMLKKQLTPNPFLKGNDYLLSNVEVKHIPNNTSMVKVEWVNFKTGITQMMEMYAGFAGAHQYSDGSLQPVISWAIGDGTKHELTDNDYDDSHVPYTETLTPAHKIWIEGILEKPEIPAKYSGDEADISGKFEAHLRKLFPKQRKHLKNIKITFVLSASNDIMRVESSTTNTEIQLAIRDYLQATANNWVPAKDNSNEFSFDVPLIIDENADRQTVAPLIEYANVNSKQTIILFGK